MRALLAIALLAPASAFANPDGAPWDHSGAPGRADCTACHFDREARRAENALELQGLPRRIQSGKRYELALTVKEGSAPSAGFLLVSESCGEPAGSFAARDDGTEAQDASIRSTEQGLARPSEAARWVFDWTAPDEIAGEVVFYIAANFSNDDASPFGDEIVLQTVTVTAK